MGVLPFGEAAQSLLLVYTLPCRSDGGGGSLSHVPPCPTALVLNYEVQEMRLSTKTRRETNIWFV